ncbi:hypothetical protein quinque_002758 [Culex quinquefasciatus]
MASKRKPIHTQPNASPRPNMNFRPGMNDTTARAEAKGTRPTATPTSIREVLTMMVLHVCKKIIFFDTNLKVPLYLGSLFFVSLIGDFLPYPKTYLARSDNLFNVYFVKMGWAWTLLFSLPFLAMSSVTICCGDHQRLVRNHLPRLGIATGFCLVLMEEARTIIGWENIKEHLRNEEFNRARNDNSQGINPLKSLKDDDLKALKYFYNRFTPTIRLLFIGMTMLQLLWDIMLVGTMLYYHRMVEKVISGIIAVLTWFITYRAWYPTQSLLPDPVGKGLFNYATLAKPEIGLRRRASLLQAGSSQQQDVPKFMGMPLYAARQQQQQQQNAANFGGLAQQDAQAAASSAAFVSTSGSFNINRLGGGGGALGGGNFDGSNAATYSRFSASAQRSRYEQRYE